MRLWSIWNLFSSFLFFLGALLGYIFLALLLAVFLPAIVAWTFAALVLTGIILGLYGNIQNTRKARRSKQTDAELAEILRHRKPQ